MVEFEGDRYVENLRFSPWGGSAGSRCELDSECWGQLEAELEFEWRILVDALDGTTGWTREYGAFDRSPATDDRQFLRRCRLRRAPGSSPYSMDDGRVLYNEHHDVELLADAAGLPWSVDIDGFRIHYGEAALERWSVQPPALHWPGLALLSREEATSLRERVRRIAYLVAPLHDRLLAGESAVDLAPMNRPTDFLAGLLIETGQVAIQSIAQATFIPHVTVLHYGYSCGFDCGRGTIHYHDRGGRELLRLALWAT